jgi:L-threonylcarbamoyladenylate synthase
VHRLISDYTPDVLNDKAAKLAPGALAPFPIENLFGVGTDETNAQVVARIYEVKGRPTDHPLIVHIADLKNLRQ